MTRLSPCLPDKETSLVRCTIAILSILFLLVVGASVVSAQTATLPASKLSAQELQVDFAILRSAYEALHPGLYRYNTQQQMDANFKALQAELSRDLTLEEAYLAFSRFTASVRCGHSYPNFFNQPKAVAASLFRGTNRVPFYFIWLGSRMIVTRNFSNSESLRRGTEILSINGVPVASIQRELMKVARADGSNDAKRAADMEVIGAGDYEAFDIYYPMMFPLPKPEFTFLALPPGVTAPVSVQTAALSYEQRLAVVQDKVERAHGGDAPLWESRYLMPQIAYLRMPTWEMYNSKWDWKGWLNRTFDEYQQRKPANLIIDLRGNEGGDDVGNVILSRLVDRDLQLNQYRRLVRYRRVPADLEPYLDTWDPSFKDWGAAAVGPVDGFYRLTRYDDDKEGDVIRPVPARYSGQVWILVDASNSSATFQFENVVQHNKLGMLVGTPTGGNQRGINGGAFFFLHLPKSKIEIDVPLIGTFPRTEMPDAGLQPDVLVVIRVGDLAAGKDTQLEEIKRRIAEQANQKPAPSRSR